MTRRHGASKLLLRGRIDATNFNNFIDSLILLDLQVGNQHTGFLYDRINYRFLYSHCFLMFYFHFSTTFRINLINDKVHYISTIYNHINYAIHSTKARVFLFLINMETINLRSLNLISNNNNNTDLPLWPTILDDS